jgi:hypothetical protein
MDRSYEDERKNMTESIKSLLVAKIMAISKTVPEMNLHESFVEKVQGWKPFEQTQVMSNYEGYHSQYRSRSHRGRTSLVASRNTFTAASAH